MTSPVPALVLDLVLLRELLRESRLRPGLRDRAETVLSATIHHLRRPAGPPAAPADGDAGADPAQIHLPLEPAADGAAPPYWLRD